MVSSKAELQNKFDKEFGKFIRKKRKEIGSIDLFIDNAPTLDISKYHYGTVERGQRSISLYKALDIIEHLNRNLDTKITINDLLKILEKCKGE